MRSNGGNDFVKQGSPQRVASTMSYRRPEWMWRTNDNPGLAHPIILVAGFQGWAALDFSYPGGKPIKRLNLTGLKLMGWRPKYDLDDD
jgi:hypothetical protein